MCNVVKPNGAVPTGYEYGGKDNPYKIVRDKACIVKKIFELGTDYCFSPADIACYLNNSKFFSKLSGKTWNDKSVRQILKNEAYMGTLVVGMKYTDPQTGARRQTNSLSWKRVENHHEAIISEEKFIEAQAIMELRKEEPLAMRNLSQIRINALYSEQLKEIRIRTDELAELQETAFKLLAKIDVIQDNCNSLDCVVNKRMEGRLNDKR